LFDNAVRNDNHFKQERVAALRRKREEQAQWEKEHITEDQ